MDLYLIHVFRQILYEWQREAFLAVLIREKLIFLHWPSELNKRETVSRIRQFNREKIHRACMCKQNVIHCTLLWRIISSFLGRS